MMRKFLKRSAQPTDAPEVEVSMAGNAPRLVNWSGKTFLVERVLETWAAPDSSDGQGQRAYVRALTGEGELLLYRSGGRWYLDAISVDDEGGEILGVDPVERVANAILELQREKEMPQPLTGNAPKRYTVKVIVPFTRG